MSGHVAAALWPAVGFSFGLAALGSSSPDAVATWATKGLLKSGEVSNLARLAVKGSYRDAAVPSVGTHASISSIMNNEGSPMDIKATIGQLTAERDKLDQA